MDISENSSYIISSIIDYVKNIGFKDPYCNITPGSEKGDNFIGIIWKANVEDRTNRTKCVSLIVKGATQDPVTRSTLSTHDLFSREVWFYQVILPIFKTLYCIKTSNKLIFANCLIATDENEKEFLVLEDMSLKGFVLHRPRIAGLDEIHVKSALTALAQFHSLSFVLKSREPKMFEDLKKQCPDAMFSPKSKVKLFKSFAENGAKKCLAVITNREHYEKLENISKDIYEKLEELVIPNEYSVFCHGDYWKNNILFKYKDAIPEAVCPIDFQMLRVSSPVNDILYLLFCCTTQDEREIHYQDYLKHYYNELRKQFEEYSLDPQLFPWSVFLSELRRCGVFGLGMAMMVVQLMTCSSETVPEATDVVGKNIEVNDPEGDIRFAKRMKGIVADCVKYGYI